jgi:hypothetical protein
MQRLGEMAIFKKQFILGFIKSQVGQMKEEDYRISTK